MSKSDIEAQFMFQIRAYGLPTPEREVMFHPSRKWRFDFCYPQMKLAIEIAGGVWSGGRHVRGAGFTKDCEKYTEAAILGWRILHFTSAQVEIGEAVGKLERALKGVLDKI